MEYPNQYTLKNADLVEHTTKPANENSCIDALLKLFRTDALCLQGQMDESQLINNYYSYILPQLKP